MTSLTPSTRLKVKRDTFFVPDPNSGIYFRNNESSFRMEGEMIDQWIEKLLPMFTGEYSLGEMTKGLPDPHRDRVFEIAGVLLKNGFVRDVSQDRPHRLAAEILQTYASQIQLLDSFGDSGAYRFQTYRQTNVLAVGSGSFFVSLVSALLESGIPKIHVRITDSAQTNRERLTELAAHARQTDAEVSVQPIPTPQEGEHAWRDIVEAFDAVLYVSETGELAELRDCIPHARKSRSCSSRPFV
jgi:putative thiazole-containing bacteriocin maturation protein